MPITFYGCIVEVIKLISMNTFPTLQSQIYSFGIFIFRCDLYFCKSIRRYKIEPASLFYIIDEHHDGNQFRTRMQLVAYFAHSLSGDSCTFHPIMTQFIIYCTIPYHLLPCRIMQYANLFNSILVCFILFYSTNLHDMKQRVLTYMT